MVRWQWLSNDVEVRDAAVKRINQVAHDAIKAQGSFHIVLAGGTTPRAIYRQLISLPTEWAKWHVYYGDERVLPADHADRNCVMAHQAWLGKVPIPQNQIHPMPTEYGLAQAAEFYANVMAISPDFDLVLLGLGEDGHTASLFPGHDWGRGSDAPDVIQVTQAPKPPPERLSLSAQRLSRAHHVLFIVTGAGKREAVSRWRHGERIPASAIHCDNGIDVLLDRAAWPEN